MECWHLNESTYQKIENFLEGSKTQENNSQENYFKSIYSPGTLINNWLENRTKPENIKPSSQPQITEYTDQFRKFCESQVPDRKEYFNKIFESYGYGQELLFDHMGFAYYDNYVSTYDLCYNHLTKGICGPFPRHYHKGKYKPSTDLSLIYGNLTQWGLKEQLKQRVEEETRDRDLTTTSENKAEYILHKMSEVQKLNNFPSFKRVKVKY